MIHDWAFGVVCFHLSEDGLYAETRFFDGSVCPAVPQPDDDLDTWYWHDFSHSFLASRMGKPFSPTLYDVARGAPVSDYHYTEEGTVNAFVAFLKDETAGNHPDLYRLAEYGDLPALRRDALLMLGANK